jgi:Flp pilus assembly protein TadD
MNLGVALLNQQDLGGATAEFESAVRLQPANVEAHINLAMAYAEASRLEDAIHHYQVVLTMDPSNAIAQRMLKLALAYREHLRRRATTDPAHPAPPSSRPLAPAEAN